MWQTQRLDLTGISGYHYRTNQNNNPAPPSRLSPFLEVLLGTAYTAHWEDSFPPPYLVFSEFIMEYCSSNASCSWLTRAADILHLGGKKKKRWVISARKRRVLNSAIKEQKTFRNLTHFSLLALSSFCLSTVSTKSMNCEQGKIQWENELHQLQTFKFLIFLFPATTEKMSSHSTGSKLEVWLVY